MIITKKNEITCTLFYTGPALPGKGPGIIRVWMGYND